ncbi:MAG: carbon-nitrogen hydrolase family protein [Planctomycetes bacterium]|nr:carbon-nitrogen hydrolase family protein [Planctomycetota bacterium]
MIVEAEQCGRTLMLLTATVALSAVWLAGCRVGGSEEAGWPPFMLAAESHPRPVKVDGPPRKVVIGTVCHHMYGPFPGIEARCEELKARVVEMDRQARARFSRGLDLVVLSEFSLNDSSAPLARRAIALDSPGIRFFQDLARQYHTYLVIPSVIVADGAYYNSAILLDREGKMMGRYDKAHAVIDWAPAETFEGGLTPGRSFPVFDCDFGRIGLQICFDYCHEEGWHELALKGAELVAWPTQSPSVSVAAARAVNNRYYVVSSTWRNDAVVIDPVGRLAAELRPKEAKTTPDGDTLVCQIDLEYRLLPWHPKLENGEALRKKYGDDVGFQFYPEEDMGVFWSNNPAIPIDRMIRSIGVPTQNEYEQAERDRLRKFRTAPKRR